MDSISLQRSIDRLVQIHSSSLIPEIERSGFVCVRCGWCCRRNFDIRITDNVSRPSNAISIFPGDIRRITKMTGRKWDEVAEADIYSCFSDGCDVFITGWILRRNDEDECVFYRDGACTIYDFRPMICRCYPFFMKKEGVEVMHCEGLGKKRSGEGAVGLASMLKRYEIKKLRSYIRIMAQLGDKLRVANLRMLPPGFKGKVFVCDGEMVSMKRL